MGPQLNIFIDMIRNQAKKAVSILLFHGLDDDLRTRADCMDYYFTDVPFLRI